MSAPNLGYVNSQVNTGFKDSQLLGYNKAIQQQLAFRGITRIVVDLSVLNTGKAVYQGAFKFMLVTQVPTNIGAINAQLDPPNGEIVDLTQFTYVDLSSAPAKGLSISNSATSATKLILYVSNVPITNLSPSVSFTNSSIAISGPAGTAQDNGLALAASALAIVGPTLLYNPATGQFQTIRTPTVFKPVQVSAAGNTAVWTPASGKKFRLMGFVISVAASLAAAGEEVIELLDSATEIAVFSVPLQSTIAQTNPIIVHLNGDGYLSAAANNVLNVNLGTVLASGHVSVFAYGTEE